MAIRSKTIQYCLGNNVSKGIAVGKAWTYNASVYTNVTTAINNATTADVTLGGAVGDIIYIGDTAPFYSFYVTASTASVGGNAVWEYWNGSAWTSVTLSIGTQMTTNVRSVPIINDWATTTINGEVDGPWYYLRLRVSTLRTTAGVLSFVSMGSENKLSNAFNVQIPETTSRTIRSAFVRVHTQTSELLAIDDFFVYGRFDSNTYTQFGERYITTNVWSRGESANYIFNIDITSIVSTAFASGTSHTFDCGLTYCTHGSATTFQRNSWAEIFITYDFDDSSATQINTIILPLDSIINDVAITDTLIGGSGGIPVLSGGSGIIKESNPVFLQTYFNILGNSNEGGTNDWNLYAKIDSGSESNLALFDAANDSDYMIDIPYITTFDGATSHDFKIRVSALNGAAISNPSALLVVTYTYTESTTTAYTHTDIIPYACQNIKMGGLVTSAQDFSDFDFWVEGTNPQLIRAGCVHYFYQNADSGNLLIGYGGQTARSYNIPGANVAGAFPITQRYDSGAVAGSGFTFSRGYNKVGAYFRVDGSRVFAGCMSGINYITYSYDKDGSHRHSTALYPAVKLTSYTPTEITNGTLNVTIPETDYFIASLGYITHDINANTSIVSTLKINRGGNNGWISYCPSVVVTDANNSTKITCANLTKLILQYKEGAFTSAYNNYADVVNKTLETNLNGPSTISYSYIYVNWHDYAYTSTITIQNSTGGNVNVSALDYNTKNPLVNGSRTGNGDIALKYYDNSRDVLIIGSENGGRGGATQILKFGD